MVRQCYAVIMMAAMKTTSHIDEDVGYWNSTTLLFGSNLAIP